VVVVVVVVERARFGESERIDYGSAVGHGRIFAPRYLWYVLPQWVPPVLRAPYVWIVSALA
jgi:hypothetical protein